jgi:hypothetical protein
MLNRVQRYNKYFKYTTIIAHEVQFSSPGSGSLLENKQVTDEDLKNLPKICPK